MTIVLRSQSPASMATVVLGVSRLPSNASFENLWRDFEASHTPSESVLPHESAQEIEEQAMWATIKWGQLHPRGLQLQTKWSSGSLEQAYQRCGTITSDYAKTFYLVRCHVLLCLLTQDTCISYSASQGDVCKERTAVSQNVVKF